MTRLISEGQLKERSEDGQVQQQAALEEVLAAGLIKHSISLPFLRIAYSVPQVYFGFWILDFGLDKSVNKGIIQNQRLNIKSYFILTCNIEPLILNEELHHLLHKNHSKCFRKKT